MARKPKNQAPASEMPETHEDDDMQNSIQQGRSINITPAADVKGGDLIVFPAMVAVASTDIPSGQLGACEAEGVFELPKDGTALAKGQMVYVNTSTGRVTATEGEGDNLRCGMAWEDASGTATTAIVKINV